MCNYIVSAIRIQKANALLPHSLYIQYTYTGNRKLTTAKTVQDHRLLRISLDTQDT